jgi:hypothetical protein
VDLPPFSCGNCKSLTWSRKRRERRGGEEEWHRVDRKALAEQMVSSPALIDDGVRNIASVIMTVVAEGTL